MTDYVLILVSRNPAAPDDGTVVHVVDEIFLSALDDAALDVVLAELDAARVEVEAMKGAP